MALLTPEEFKRLPLGLRDTQMDKMGELGLADFIATASQQVAEFCRRQLEPGEVKQEVVGNGANRLLLGEWPVTDISAVTVEDGAGTIETLDPAGFRYTTSGIVRFVDGSTFTAGYIYTFTYTAGYSPVPYPLKHATALWTTELMQPVFNQGSAGKPVALIELSSEQISELLENFKRKGAR